RCNLPHHHMFFIPYILRTPPRSTPCPYSTLFRSRTVAQVILDEVPHTEHAQWHPVSAPVGCHPGYKPEPVLSDYAEVAAHRGGEDRKSTRLNSSHVSRSYAVFCLTKKTPTYTYIS